MTSSILCDRAGASPDTTKSTSNTTDGDPSITSSSSGWHQSPAWINMLKIYDGIAHEMFTKHEHSFSKQIPTSFGSTRVHMRSPSSHDDDTHTLVFFHGISSNSLMFGDWLFPELCQEYHCIAMDTIGDLGGSMPRNGDPKQGPKTEQEVADWAMQVLRATVPEFESLQQNNKKKKKVHVLGYSFGCYISACLAKYHPDVVDKMIWLAPVGLMSPVRKTWLAQAIGFAILSRLFPSWQGLKEWFFGSMMADVSCMKNLQYPELRESMDAIGSPQVQIQPNVWEMSELQELTKAHSILMVMGRHESVIDPQEAVQRANECGVSKIQIYENAGHMFFCEPPYDKDVIQDILRFL